VAYASNVDQALTCTNTISKRKSLTQWGPVVRTCGAPPNTTTQKLRSGNPYTSRVWELVATLRAKSYRVDNQNWICYF